MVFKLNGEVHNDALQLERSKLFDPSGKNRPMREWVQVPYNHSDKWEYFAEKAFHYLTESR